MQVIPEVAMELVSTRTGEVNRLHKVLEDAGVKLATVATDVMGVSGREMMRALIDGVTDPQVLADLARARLRTKLPQLRKALTARFGEHHAFLLARMLAHVEALEADIDVLSERIAELVESHQVWLFTTRLDVPRHEQRLGIRDPRFQTRRQGPRLLARTYSEVL